MLVSAKDPLIMVPDVRTNQVRGIPVLPVLTHARGPIHLPTHIHRIMRYLGKLLATPIS